jgi:hypothetical protein
LFDRLFIAYFLHFALSKVQTANCRQQTIIKKENHPIGKIQRASQNLVPKLISRLFMFFVAAAFPPPTSFLRGFSSSSPPSTFHFCCCFPLPRLSL